MNLLFRGNLNDWITCSITMMTRSRYISLLKTFYLFHAKYFAIFILESILLISCGSKTDDKLVSLYRQRIDSSKYVLYNYVYSGDFLFSGNFEGVAILDSNIKFSRDKIILSGDETNRLPWNVFEAKPAKQTFRIIDINRESPQVIDTCLNPTKIYTETYNNNKFNVREFKMTYGIGFSGCNFKFDSLRETNDSVTFYNVKKSFCRLEFQSTVSFVKGNIKIIDTGDHKIDHLEINQPFIGRGAFYKPGNPLKIVPNQPIVEIVTYSFYPNKSLLSKSLSDFGFYKRIK